MPKGPRGEKRPGDVIGAAIMVAKIATGEEQDNTTADVKAAAGKLGGRKGGPSRAAKLTAAERSAAAQKAAKARWKRPD